jgi:hypothetical protein
MNRIVYVFCSARVHVFLHLDHLHYAHQNPKLNTQLRGRELPAVKEMLRATRQPSLEQHLHPSSVWPS